MCHLVFAAVVCCVVSTRWCACVRGFGSPYLKDDRQLRDDWISIYLFRIVCSSTWRGGGLAPRRMLYERHFSVIFTWDDAPLGAPAIVRYQPAAPTPYRKGDVSVQIAIVVFELDSILERVLMELASVFSFFSLVFALLALHLSRSALGFAVFIFILFILFYSPLLFFLLPLLLLLLLAEYLFCNFRMAFAKAKKKIVGFSSIWYVEITPINLLSASWISGAHSTHTHARTHSRAYVRTEGRARPIPTWTAHTVDFYFLRFVLCVCRSVKVEGGRGREETSRTIDVERLNHLVDICNGPNGEFLTKENICDWLFVGNYILLRVILVLFSFVCSFIRASTPPPIHRIFDWYSKNNRHSIVELYIFMTTIWAWVYGWIDMKLPLPKQQ